MPVTLYARETGLKVGIKEEQRSTFIFPVVCARRSLGMYGTQEGTFLLKYLPEKKSKHKELERKSKQ